MTNITVNTQTMRRPMDMQRVAWFVLISSFLLFCSTSLIFSGGIFYFLFHSSVPMLTEIQVGRGTAGLIEADFSQQVIRDAEPFALVERDSRISTDAQSQAVLSFHLDYDSNAPVLATITLENNTSLQFSQATRPRFSWTEGRYLINLSQFTGELDVFISREIDRDFRLRIYTDTGASVRISDAGRYSIQYDGSKLVLNTREGRGLLFAPQDSQWKLVSKGEESAYLKSRDIMITAIPSNNLLENSLFSFPQTSSNSQQILPSGWGCSPTADAPPIGNFLPDLWQGRPAIRLLRANGANTHGQTKCFQGFGAAGYEITDLNYLEIQTTFLINYQSLSSCGVDGSECPMMLLLYYLDENGNEQEWHQGFYARRDSQATYPQPLTCTTCYQRFQEHIRIGERVWYTYESGNLLTQFTTRNVPHRITRLEFYASGHEYDIYVSDVSLLAGIESIVPPNPNSAPAG